MNPRRSYVSADGRRPARLGSLVTGQAAASPRRNSSSLWTSSHLDVPDSPDLSVATTGSLTVSAWMRPDTLSFPKTEAAATSTGWQGRRQPARVDLPRVQPAQPGEPRQPHQLLRLQPVESAAAHLGIGSYFQDPITPGQWSISWRG